MKTTALILTFLIVGLSNICCLQSFLKRVQRKQHKSNKRVQKRRKEDDFQTVYKQFLDDDNFFVTEDSFYQMFSKMSLSMGESKYIFNLMDLDHDRKINIKEFSQFMEQFLIPFQTCDPDNSYFIDQAQMLAETCLFMSAFPAEQEPELHIDVKNATQSVMVYLGAGDMINFYGYLVVRKLVASFQLCGDGRTLSRTQVQCGLKVLSKKRIVTDGDGYMVFDLVTYLQQGIKTDTNQLLGFREYLQVGYIWLLYNEFGFIRNTDGLHLKEVLGAIDEQKLPSFLDRQVVKTIFDEKEVIDYSQWGVGVFLSRMFVYYDKDYDQEWSKEEWLDFLKDVQVNTWVKYWIDLLPQVQQDQVDALDSNDEVASKYTANDYLAFSRFNNHKTHPHNHKHNNNHNKHNKNVHNSKNINVNIRANKKGEEVPENKISRSVVWEMFRSSPKETFKLPNLYNFYRVSYKFILEDNDFSGFLSLPEIKHMYTVDTEAGPLQLRQNQMQYIFQLVQFFKEIQFGVVNIKQFYAFFTMREVLAYYTVASVQNIFMGRQQIEKIGQERFDLKFTKDMFSVAKIINFSKEKQNKDELMFDGMMVFRQALKYEVNILKNIKIKGDARFHKHSNTQHKKHHNKMNKKNKRLNKRIVKQ